MVFYTLYKNGLFVDYGIHSTMKVNYPLFNELHDELQLLNVNYDINITNINEVSSEQYFANLNEQETEFTRKKYINHILGELSDIEDSFDGELYEQVDDAIEDNNNNYDVTVISFIVLVLEKYINSPHCKATINFYESRGYSDIDYDDKVLTDEVNMAYKYEIARLISEFRSYNEYADYDTNRLNNNFLKLSKLLPGLWS